jgi:hypothetical protein
VTDNETLLGSTAEKHVVQDPAMPPPLASFGSAPSNRQLLGDCRGDDRAIGNPICGHLRYLRLGDANSALEPQMTQSDAD